MLREPTKAIINSHRIIIGDEYITNEHWAVRREFVKKLPTLESVEVHDMDSRQIKSLADMRRASEGNTALLMPSGSSYEDKYGTYLELERMSGDSIYIQEHYYQWLAGLPCLSLYAGHDYLSPIRIESDGRFVGLIMPVRPPPSTWSKVGA